MARTDFQTLPGTRDLMEPDTGRIRHLVAVFAEEARKAGFGQIVPPMFEDVGVFVRLGEASDVVSKELYSFLDKGEREISLRPEFTASVCRAYAQHRPLLPWKTWYVGPSFRYDKPQKGRYRQFDQVGVEVIGSEDPDLDTEVIALAAGFYQRLGLTDVRLDLNSLGDAADRPRYLEALTAYLTQNLDALSEQARMTMKVNPLRVLDSKRPQDGEVVASAPILLDYVSDSAGQAFERVQTGLTALGVGFTIQPRLVRGLDYYTRTAFEFTSPSLDAAQTAVGGGGRYDGLVEALGGPPEPGVGFALGVDRILLACDATGVLEAAGSGPDVWIVSTTDGTEALELTDRLRQSGLRVERSYGGRSMKAQMKAANRSQAPIALILGPDEVSAGTVSIRTLRWSAESVGSTGADEVTGENPAAAPAQQIVVAVQDVVEKVRSLLP